MFQDLSFLVKVTFYYCKALKIQNCPVNVVLRDEVGQKGQQKKKIHLQKQNYYSKLLLQLHGLFVSKFTKTR